MLKTIKSILIGVLSFIVLYLGIVWLWANSAADELLELIEPSNTLVQLDQEQVDALLKIEDPTFFEHSGQDISNGQGLTTITSSVARTVFLEEYELNGVKGGLQSFYRAVFDCCKKIDLGRDVMALVLNAHLEKNKQLEIFLNSAYLGTADGVGVIGFESAAKSYYHKSVPDLTDDEFYGIVAMLLYPNYYHPIKNPEIHAERVRRIKAVINGQCQADGWLDLTFGKCCNNA